MRRITVKLGLMGALIIGASAASRPAHAAGTITVNTTADNDVNDGVCSLREAMIAINTNASYHGCTNTTTANIISLPVGTITLTSALPVASGFPRTIRGTGYNFTVVDGGNFAGFHVSSSNLTLQDLTAQHFNGSALLIDAGASGGVSYSKILRSGGSTTAGGCVENSGVATISKSQLELCNAFTGGAVRNEASGSMDIDSSTILKCTGEHGVIYNAGQMQITASTIGANSTGVSATVYNFGGNVTVFSSSLLFNKATLSTGVRGLFNDPSGHGTMDVGNSVISSWGGDSSHLDCSGAIDSDGNNAFNSGTGCNFTAAGDRVISDPQVQNNTSFEDGFINTPMVSGGVGRVYLPNVGSPLVGQVSGNTLWGDQRGIRRKAINDIGAVQRGDALLVVGNTMLSIGDQQIQSTLAFLGFAVTTRTDAAVTAADANGKTVVVISESVQSTNVNTKLRDTAAGVCVLEPALFDDMNMTTAANTGTVNGTQMNFARSGTAFNFFASAMGSYGVLSVTSSSVGYGWGIPGSEASIGAQNTANGSQKHAFYYASGGTMANGFVAPGRRVGTGLTNAATPILTTVGQRLLEESILLASGPTAF